MFHSRLGRARAAGPVAPKTSAALGLIGLAVVLVWWDRRAAESRSRRERGEPCGSD